MATTNGDDLWTPDAGDDYALTVDLAAFADTVQTGLNNRVKKSDMGAATYNIASNQVADASITANAATTVVPAQTNNSGFVISSAGTVFTVTPGYYNCSALIKLNTAGTGRCFVEIQVNGELVNRNTVFAPEDSYGVSAGFYVSAQSTVTVQFFKTTGGGANITGRVALMKLGAQ